MREFPLEGIALMEDWLLDLANARGVTVVSRNFASVDKNAPLPDCKTLPNAELVTAICQPQNRDRPQWLRAAAQLISQGVVDLEKLARLAKMERVERILAELAKQALRVEPTHEGWRQVADFTGCQAPLRDSLLHWTRIAEPVPNERRVGVKEWRLPK
jgi:hypothetical protein